VKGEIINDLRSKFQLEHRKSLINNIKTDPSLKLNEEEVNKYYVDLEAILKQDPAAVK